ncbi:MAG: ABC transporter ATP-binding protein [Thiobacillaceae bacterium]|nr:ABC transporter ATP-binding protein [Thiobacillaceae bacterium]MCX7673884.1 ABC transporter ATP-binding protein [Thiobacillaceae bacterium]MDW8323312.1 ABC transporter ATP-binding protein [Burkholderiales bacterium]
MSPVLEVVGLSHRYGDKPVLNGVDFSLAPGELGCLLGPSGCGKTTVLRLIAGFEPPMAGEIRLMGERVSAAGYALPPERRAVGMVFQDYALFPHLTVAANVAFGLGHLDAAARRERVRQMLATVGLTGRERAYPHELSGGQQQRVALARALAPRPRLLLMDEPFSNLDVDLREKLALEVREILKREGITALMVTHDQHEAFAMADTVGVMHEGRIQQWDSPYRLYHQPANRFVADFVGQGVLLEGRVLNDHQVEIELGVLEGYIPTECLGQGGCSSCGRGCRVEVLVRPDDIIHDDLSPVLAEVERKAFRGAEFLYTLRLPQGGRVLALVPSHHNHAIGEKIGIRLAIDHVVAFKA